MPLTQSDEKVCASHIFIPYEIPVAKDKYKKKDLKDVVEYLSGYLNRDPSKFGSMAYILSFDPSSQSNHRLDTCIHSISAKDEKDFRAKARQCVSKYGGDLGCFTKKEVDDKFYDAVASLKMNEITKKPIETKFGYHIIRRNSPEY